MPRRRRRCTACAIPRMGAAWYFAHIADDLKAGRAQRPKKIARRRRGHPRRRDFHLSRNPGGHRPPEIIDLLCLTRKRKAACSSPARRASSAAPSSTPSTSAASRTILVTDVLAQDAKWEKTSSRSNSTTTQADELLAALGVRQPRQDRHDLPPRRLLRDHRDRRRLPHREQLPLYADARRVGARERRRFVYASSAATYGDGAKGMDDRDEDLAKLRPLNLYGYSKHLFDLHAQRRGYLNDIVGINTSTSSAPNEWQGRDAQPRLQGLPADRRDR